MQILLKSLRKEQWARLVTAVLMTTLGGLFIYLFFNKNHIIVILSLGLLVLGIRFLRGVLKEWDFENQKLIQLINNQPTKIVWVYSMVTERMPFGLALSKQGLLYFKLENGDDIAVNISNANLKIVTRFLKRLLPHATFGYTPERMRLYHQNSHSFLHKNKEKENM